MTKETRAGLHPTDEELIAKFQNGDLYAFDVLVRRYKNQLTNFVCRFVGNREEAEDIVQDTFVRLYRNKHSYRRIARFSTWIYTIAGNLAKTALRKRKGRRLLAISQLGCEDKDYEIEDSAFDPEQEVDGTMKGAIIQREIDRLPPKFREVIILRDIQELSYEEISEIIKAPLGTVKSRVNRARLRLQKRLEEIAAN
ncbi:MAG: sigma-70 family RNA polymerase sigma factor [bacterium]|jgi:RNA polymerase sigma-70 factor (ECF subfamily)|nr:sigma-70 family RNA polymerase sigma factor [candidate division KSB1 bacterium]MDH7559050.1 sigma-70 family RNA polymerase sigma factor [bacterium]